MEIGGVVQKGKGEGSFFMSLHPYLEGMEKELGYTPYQGTLNVHANKQRANAFISSLKAVRIPGFTKGTKTNRIRSSESQKSWSHSIKRARTVR